MTKTPFSWNLFPKLTWLNYRIYLTFIGLLILVLSLAFALVVHEWSSLRCEQQAKKTLEQIYKYNVRVFACIYSNREGWNIWRPIH